jgi:hypothetical protein
MTLPELANNGALRFEGIYALILRRDFSIVSMEGLHRS